MMSKSPVKGDKIKGSLAKASGKPAKNYPKVGAGKDLNWKKPNSK